VERERAFLDATISVVSIEDWKRVVRRALEDAVKGDSRARHWLSNVILGRDPLGLADTLADLRAALSPDDNVNQQS
jgi:hypothetical protein